MSLINPNSLYETIDATQAALFSYEDINAIEKSKVAEWLAGRQGLPGSYRGMFAPTETDFSGTVRTFTGEEISSKAAKAHILSEETCRLLLLLDVHTPRTDQALKAASDDMLNSIRGETSERHIKGRYCCGTCSAALWRHLAAGGLKEEPGLLEAGIKSMVKCRDGKGRWRFFPFYYTLLVLSECDPYLTKAELIYAQPAIDNAFKKLEGEDEKSNRRRAVLERLMAIL